MKGPDVLTLQASQAHPSWPVAGEGRMAAPRSLSTRIWTRRWQARKLRGQTGWLSCGGSCHKS